MAPATTEARMAKALPQQWPGHCFSRPEVEAVLAKLREHQEPQAAPFVGERLAIALLEKAPAELKEPISEPQTPHVKSW